MSSSRDDHSAVSQIDRWFQDHCDGTWEHHLGLTIETTDNPGWLMTFNELKLTQDALAEAIGDLLRKYGAQVSTDGTMVRVFANSLQNCLIAGTILIELGE